MQYDSYRYLVPPRPENAIHPDTLGFYQKRKFWAQVKKNGTCSVIYLPPKGEGDPFARTRHADAPQHRAWSFTEKSIEGWRKRQNDKWHVFCAELLHSKGSTVKDTNYVHDVLVFQGRYLINSTLAHRQGLMKTIFGLDVIGEGEHHWVVEGNIWMAKNYQKGFAALYESLTDPLDEGLVLKSSEATLGPATNSSWMVKCRKGTKNFSF